MQRSDGPAVGLVHPHCAPKPGAYTGADPETFRGKMVKLGFDNKDPNGKTKKEHMWVKVLRVVDADEFPTGEQLVGVLDNDPILRCEYKCGDILAFNVSEIEEVWGE